MSALPQLASVHFCVASDDLQFINQHVGGGIAISKHSDGFSYKWWVLFEQHNVHLWARVVNRYLIFHARVFPRAD